MSVLLSKVNSRLKNTNWNAFARAMTELSGGPRGKGGTLGWRGEREPIAGVRGGPQAGVVAEILVGGQRSKLPWSWNLFHHLDVKKKSQICFFLCNLQTQQITSICDLFLSNWEHREWAWHSLLNVICSMRMGQLYYWKYVGVPVLLLASSKIMSQSCLTCRHVVCAY